MTLRHGLIGLGLALALIVVNLGIAGRERLLRSGETILLELAPVDPRSLMQGDYMALRFAVAQHVSTGVGESMAPQDEHRDGYLILARAADGRTTFVRQQPQPGPLASSEIALRYRVRGGEPLIVSNAWFFPEGQAERYQPARYGELRVGTDGEALLTGLRDAELKPL